MTVLGFDAMMIAWGAAVLALATWRHFYFDRDSARIELPGSGAGCREQG